MLVNHYRLKPHAKRRMQQRNITREELQLALECGQIEYRAGTKFYFLGTRDIPTHLRRSHARLAGLTVVIANDAIVTLYRNPRAHAAIRRRDKRQMRNLRATF